MIFAVIAVFAARAPGHDFLLHLEAAEAVAAGRSPYSPPRPDICGEFRCFHYPPPVAVLFVPLLLIPKDAAVALATATYAVVAIVAVGALIRPLLPVLRPWVAAAAALFFPLLLDLNVGNLDIVTMAAAVAAWALRERATGGVLLAVAVGLKLVAAPLVLFYAAARLWRTLAWAAATWVAVAAVTAPVVGAYWSEFAGAALYRANEGFRGIQPTELVRTDVYVALVLAACAVLIASGAAARRARPDRGDHHALALAVTPLFSQGLTYVFLVLCVPLLIAIVRALSARPALLVIPTLVWLAMEMPAGMEAGRFGGYLGAIVVGVAVLLAPALRTVSAGSSR